MTIETSNYEIIVVSFLQKEKRAEVLSNRGFLIKRAIQREKMDFFKARHVVVFHQGVKLMEQLSLLHYLL